MHSHNHNHPHTAADSAMIQLSGVGMQWERNTALRDVNLTVRRGDFMAITGPNGGGKTTLLRIILKLLKPSEGTVTYFGTNGAPTATLPIGYLPQKNLIDQRFPITVAEVVASGLAAWGATRAERRRRTAVTLDTVGLGDLADRPIGQISGGQLQRTLLGRAIISQPELLVLDEPLSYVDKQFEHRIYDLVDTLSRSTTILLVSHEMSTIASMANRHLIVDGSIHECAAAHHMVHYDCDECN